MIIVVSFFSANQHGEFFSRVSTIVPDFWAFSSGAPALDLVAGGFYAASLSPTVTLISIEFSVGPLSGAGVALVGRSSSSLTPTSYTLFRSFMVVVSAESLSGGTSDASALYTGTLSRQLDVARCQRDSALQKLASVRSELYHIRVEKEELRLVFALLHGPFDGSCSSLLALVTQLDAITSQFPFR